MLACRNAYVTEIVSLGASMFPRRESTVKIRKQGTVTLLACPSQDAKFDHLKVFSCMTKALVPS